LLNFNELDPSSSSDPQKNGVEKRLCLVRIPPAESPIRLDLRYFLKVEEIKDEDRVSVRIRGSVKDASKAFFEDNCLQFCRVGLLAPDASLHAPTN
jgi:hypothetical protein